MQRDECVYSCALGLRRPVVDTRANYHCRIGVDTRRARYIHVLLFYTQIANEFEEGETNAAEQR
jgi:hypothetical protein